MDPYRTRICLSLKVAIASKSFRIYGGDDGARTRDLCRDSPAFWRNLLKLGAADGFFQRPETPMATVIGPLLDPRPLPCGPLP